MATLGARTDNAFYDQVAKAAAAEGLKVSAYLLKAVEEKLARGNGAGRNQPSLLPVGPEMSSLSQLARVKAVMSDAKWRSLAEIALLIGVPDSSIPSVSSRLRALRDKGYTVNRRGTGPGYFEYQVEAKA